MKEKVKEKAAAYCGNREGNINSRGKENVQMRANWKKKWRILGTVCEEVADDNRAQEEV